MYTKYTLDYLNQQITCLDVKAAKLPKLWRRLRGKSYQLLFLHGVNDSAQNHLEMLEDLARKGFDVYSFNYPGFGGSAKFSLLSWDILVELATHFAQTKKLKDITVVGYSMGGTVSLLLLERSPLQIRELKLIAPFCLPISRKDISVLNKIMNYFKHYISHRSQMRSTIPDPLKVDMLYTIQRYVELFFCPLGLNPEKHDIAVHAVLLADDEVISNVQTAELLSRFPNHKIDVLDGVGHGIYYIENDYKQQLVNLLFS